MVQKKAPQTAFITTSEICGFGIGFGIGRKYRPITVSVSVLGLNQNSDFGRSLPQICITDQVTPEKWTIPPDKLP